MKLRPLSRAEIREVDRIAIEDYAIPGMVLMENAGAGAAAIIDQLQPTGKIVILCGKGNNAGDGYVIARHLELGDRDVSLVSIVPLDSLVGDAAANLEIARRSQLSICLVNTKAEIEAELASADVLVDCLLGTGARGLLRGLFADAVNAANERTCLKVAIDVPTGLDCDTGDSHEFAFRAEHTITFVAPKIGMVLPHARQFVGEIHVVSIGAPRKVLESFQ